MSKNLLTGVNDVLKKVQVVSATNPLLTLTNSAKQVFIDLAIQSWNEGVDQIYSKSKVLRPRQGEEDSIVLISAKRTYDLPCDLVQIRWPLHEETQGLFINKYPGEYEELKHALVQPGNYTGQPQTAAISPVDNELYLDMIPTASEADYEYKYYYWKDTEMTKASEVFPFSDTVYRAMVPVVTEVWRYYQNNRFSDGIAKVNYGRAVRTLKQEPGDTAWIKRPGGNYVTNPIGKDPYVQ